MDSIGSTISYTVLTLLIVLLIKVCNDKRKEWKELQQEIKDKGRMAAHDVSETEDEKRQQEEAIRKIIDNHYKESPEGDDQKSTFDL